MWSTGKGAIFVGGNDVVRALWGGECGACGALEENSIKISEKIEKTTNDGQALQEAPHSCPCSARTAPNLRVKLAQIAHLVVYCAISFAAATKPRFHFCRTALKIHPSIRHIVGPRFSASPKAPCAVINSGGPTSTRHTHIRTPSLRCPSRLPFRQVHNTLPIIVVPGVR